MKHWIFDLDGTLVDSFSQYFTSLKSIFNDYGVEFESHLKHGALTVAPPLFLQTHLGKENALNAYQKLQTLSIEGASQIRTFAGVEELLIHLKGSGAKIGIWTARDYETASLIVNHSGLHQYIEEFVSGTCTPLRKPDPAGLLKVINSFDASADQVTMVGDHEHDVTAAKKVGARPVRASWHSYWKVDTCEHTPHQFHDFESFTRWAKGEI